MKRTKIVRKAEKVLSCCGKTVLWYVAILVCAIILSACHTQKFGDSWTIYCQKYGVDIDNPEVEEEDYYLDCYIGSAEEEKDLEEKYE